MLQSLFTDKARDPPHTGGVQVVVTGQDANLMKVNSAARQRRGLTHGHDSNGANRQHPAAARAD
jgi:hypothetical protein